MPDIVLKFFESKFICFCNSITILFIKTSTAQQPQQNMAESDGRKRLYFSPAEAGERRFQPENDQKSVDGERRDTASDS